MRQSISTRPFIADVVAQPTPPPAGIWSHLTDEPGAQPIGNAIAAISHLLEGDVNLRHINGSDPALVADFTAPSSTIKRIAYRMRSNQIYSTGSAPMDPAALTLFAARLLLNRSHYFSRDYLELLRAVSEHRDQGTLDLLMLAAADALEDETRDLLRTDAGPAAVEVVWFYAVRPENDAVIEITATDGRAISPLFSDFAIASTYLRSGEPTAYDALKTTPICGYWGAGQTW